ncbi:cation:proton antiporter [Peptacetobacter sp.]|uniref:cation:proton antiporter n=1 Tax=Peptacetobacter sp. TaxID=2991975 RepID=UPI002608FF05|nr:cation:proton antiporter [Peptacetobacter sp.]
MLTSLALIFLVGLSLASICEKLKLPRIIGMLITGVILGPYVLNLFDESILGISSELRKIALIIIIIKAGLSLDLKDLKKVGRPALLMSFLPASFELLAYVVFAPYLLEISKLEAALMGAVLSAVSPAIVVPRMVNLIETNSGTKKGIPQMILAGASFDDIFVIVLFTTFLSMNQGESVSFMSFANIPISVISGITLGAIVGFLLYKFFETRYINEHLVRNSIKTIIILAISFLLISLETFLEGKLAMSGLLAVMSMSLVIALKSTNIVKVRLQEKFGKLWLAAEVILFVLVGAAVDIRYTMEAGIMAIVMIFIALIIRSIGVFICTIKTNLSKKERFFCVLSYLPKATVQAAIGSVPLAAGLPCGKIILSVAVLAIIITAPLGAFAMDISAKKFLD